MPTQSEIKELAKTFALPLAGTVIAGYISLNAIVPAMMEDVERLSKTVEAVSHRVESIREQQVEVQTRLKHATEQGEENKSSIQLLRSKDSELDGRVKLNEYKIDRLHKK